MASLALACSPGERTSATSSAGTPFAGPSLRVPFIASPGVRIDGKLDEPSWQQAARSEAFVGARDGQKARGALGGRARLFFSDAHLYVAFDVTDPRLRGGFPQDAIDPHLWERDTVELMLDPDGADNRDYYEIQINPQGLVFDSRFDDYNLPRGGPAGPFGDQGWSSQVERAVSVRGTLDDDSDRDDGYTVEARIPWAAFDRAKRVPPGDGDTWKANLYAMEDNGGVAWSPILGEGNFHRVRYFGDLVFAR